MNLIEQALGHRFRQRSLLEEALTHRSYVFEHGGTDNERLEFLGDSVLNCCTTILLFQHFQKENEGGLSRIRSRLVNTDTLATIGAQIGVGAYLRLGRGEETTGGRKKTSLLADATEALVGALFAEAGFDACRTLIAGWMEPRIQKLAEETGDDPWKDPRSRLQETTQQRWRLTPTYEVTRTDGPSHAPTFEVSVRIGDRPLGSGIGGTKRDASQMAASEALKTLDSESSGT